MTAMSHHPIDAGLSGGAGHDSLHIRDIHPNDAGEVLTLQRRICRVSALLVRFWEL